MGNLGVKELQETRGGEERLDELGGGEGVHSNRMGLGLL